MDNTRPISLINVQCQLGAGRFASGAGWNSRVELIKAHLNNCGLTVANIFTITEPRTADLQEQDCRYLGAVVKVLQQLLETVSRSLERGQFPVTLGGDHSLAIASVSAASRHLRLSNSGPLGLLWIDAHIDMNTPATTPSGNLHGMALAALLGIGRPELCTLGSQSPAVQPEHTAVVGYRFADRAELQNLPVNGPAIYSMRDLERLTADSFAEEILRRVAVQTGGVHISLDLDSLDPSFAPAVNTPCPGGMTFREVRSLCERVATTGQLMSLDIVEHNPEKGNDELMIPLIGELIACSCAASSMIEIPPPGPSRLRSPGDGHNGEQII